MHDKAMLLSMEVVFARVGYSRVLDGQAGSKKTPSIAVSRYD